MDWQRPINALIPGLEGHILQRLWLINAPQTAGQIHQRAGTGSLNGVRYALRRLVDQGLVTEERVGQQYQYTLNRDHLAYPALNSALEAYDPYGELRGRLADLVANTWPSARPAPNLYMYGSVAQRTGDSESDLDLLVIIHAADQDAPHLDSLTEALQTQPEQWTGNPVHLYIATREDLRRMSADGDPIVASWLATADTVTGEDIERIVRTEAA